MMAPKENMQHNICKKKTRMSIIHVQIQISFAITMMKRE